MPLQNGKTVIVTGANTGLGYETALALYEKGADVVVACRDMEKAEGAIGRMKESGPAGGVDRVKESGLAGRLDRMKESGGVGTLEPAALDLASLASVKRFAELFLKEHDRLDILINNAGVMMTPLGKTEEGFELQFGVNFIGHFDLTGRLYPLLKRTRGARVVTMSSGAHKWVETIDFDNLRSEKDYDPVREYGMSKLADLVFTLELQRRISLAGDDILSLAAHPGITRTDLQRHIDPTLIDKRYAVVMEPWQGALPELFAATAASVGPGGYYGPDGEKELVGYPTRVEMGEGAKDLKVGARLWALAEKATGIVFPGEPD